MTTLTLNPIHDDQVILDSFGGKPVAFKYGQRPFQNVVCEGLEEGSCGGLSVPRRLGAALVVP